MKSICKKKIKVFLVFIFFSFSVTGSLASVVMKGYPAFMLVNYSEAIIRGVLRSSAPVSEANDCFERIAYIHVESVMNGSLKEGQDVAVLYSGERLVNGQKYLFLIAKSSIDALSKNCASKIKANVSNANRYVYLLPKSARSAYELISDAAGMGGEGFLLPSCEEKRESIFADGNYSFEDIDVSGFPRYKGCSLKFGVTKILEERIKYLLNLNRKDNRDNRGQTTIN